jgi:hypothetical protein
MQYNIELLLMLRGVSRHNAKPMLQACAFK